MTKSPPSGGITPDGGTISEIATLLTVARNDTMHMFNAKLVLESLHWLELLKNRDIIIKSNYNSITAFLEDLNLSLNAFIKSNYQSKAIKTQ